MTHDSTERDVKQGFLQSDVQNVRAHLIAELKHRATEPSYFCSESSMCLVHLNQQPQVQHMNSLDFSAAPQAEMLKNIYCTVGRRVRFRRLKQLAVPLPEAAHSHNI